MVSAYVLEFLVFLVSDCDAFGLKASIVVEFCGYAVGLLVFDGIDILRRSKVFFAWGIADDKALSRGLFDDILIFLAQLVALVTFI